MSTSIRDLIDALETAAADLGDETPVRIAYQPSYPLAAEVAAVSAAGVSDDTDRTAVWLAATATVSSAENPYAPGEAWEGEYL